MGVYCGVAHIGSAIDGPQRIPSVVQGKKNALQTVRTFFVLPFLREFPSPLLPRRSRQGQARSACWRHVVPASLEEASYSQYFLEVYGNLAAPSCYNCCQCCLEKAKINKNGAFDDVLRTTRTT